MHGSVVLIMEQAENHSFSLVWQVLVMNFGYLVMRPHIACAPSITTQRVFRHNFQATGHFVSFNS